MDQWKEEGGREKEHIIIVAKNQTSFCKPLEIILYIFFLICKNIVYYLSHVIIYKYTFICVIFNEFKI